MEKSDMDWQKDSRIHALERAFHDHASIVIEELWNAPKAFLASLAQKVTAKHILLLTGGNQEELRLYHDFDFFTQSTVIDFPAWETLPSDSLPPSPDVVGDRYKVLQHVIADPEPVIILANLQACLQKVVDIKELQKLYLSLQVSASHPFESLIQQFTQMGYVRQSTVSDKGEFAVRGGIIDIYPVSTTDPYRIEFWGDEISSIRTFDPVGQKSVLPVKEISIPPAKELELLHKTARACTILDYLGPNTLVIFDDILALEDRYASLVSMGGTPSHTFGSLEAFLDQIEPLQKIYLANQPLEELCEVHLLDKKGGNYYSENIPLHSVSFQAFNRSLEAYRWQAPFAPIASYLLPEVSDTQAISGHDILEALSKISHTSMHLHVLAEGEREQTHFQQKLSELKISLPEHTTFYWKYLSSGFVLPEISVMLLPLTEISQRYKIRRQKQRSTYHTAAPSTLYELVPGELIVHLTHGIGRYLGLEKRPNHEGILTEFFKIEYADQGALYVPIQQAYLITKYIGSNSEEIPRLHTIGSSRWKKTREQTEIAIVGYAKSLLNLYAQRSIKEGHAYPQDSLEMHSFEEEFPFVETEDQLEAIKAIKKDLMASTSMDRLVCGDVGYGKTEVAMRAAFKAVIDGHKQVAVLVPTTVLAMQHYENFVDRMRHFPVNIALMSRFRSVKEMNATLKNVKEGSVDILIGTHRIISKDVVFKDLGLVIIDEEQRFGVKAKEHLKNAKINVDSLSLSATPIPRTLYMSLVGVRDMSLINTPPQDRLPITTLITESSDDIIKNALLRELARDGQVFIIHNRVETIYGRADKIRQLLPHARIVVAHGQMDAKEVDQVFHIFKNGQADILIATTIVENGIDIPNANTILIESADHFGLADLYQLRGRVGRWNRRAYCYFLVRNLQRLPEISRKRLSALAEASGYGGGMKIAMRDLEIRGAGNLLGTEQSGHVSAIGFHLYCKLLKRTVKMLQGEECKEICDTKIEIPVDARLPEDYVNAVSLRMEIYQRLGEALSWKEVDDLLEELKDRFGTPPEPVLWLYYMTRIRVFASTHHITHVKLEKHLLTIERKSKIGPVVAQHIVGKIHKPSDLDKIMPFLNA
jgi:transcription-repair coupling factor (superfamily II helicase)